MAATNTAGRAAVARKRQGTDRQRTGSAAVAHAVLDRVRGRLDGALNDRKDRVTDVIDGVAEVVRRVGEPLREVPYAPAARYTEDAASRLHELATTLRDRDVMDLAADLGDLARRRPAVFAGAGLAVGVLAARFLKSSSRRGDRNDRPADQREGRRPSRERGGPQE